MNQPIPFYIKFIVQNKQGEDVVTNLSVNFVSKYSINLHADNNIHYAIKPSRSYETMKRKKG